MSLDGKLFLVTGAGIRLGREIALEIAKAGGDVVIHYNRSEEDAQRLSREIEARMGRKSYALQADFNDPSQVISLVPRANEHGRLFGLVNSASIFGTQTWQNTTLEEWNKHLMINLTAPFLLSQAFARQVPPDGHGRIINMLDWRGERPGSDHFPYTIAKAGLGALTQSLAVALAPRITVNGLALGAILPPSGGTMPREAIEKAPAKRQANLEEVTQAVIFLLDGPEYITGDIIHVDGGRHLV
jgi:NAD(P)-dependent dehydrogenase (short-subunit alcohol dehydrogenase family)